MPICWLQASQLKQQEGYYSFVVSVSVPAVKDVR